MSSVNVSWVEKLVIQILRETHNERKEIDIYSFFILIVSPFFTLYRIPFFSGPRNC